MLRFVILKSIPKYLPGSETVIAPWQTVTCQPQQTKSCTTCYSCVLQLLPWLICSVRPCSCAWHHSGYLNIAVHQLQACAPMVYAFLEHGVRLIPAALSLPESDFQHMAWHTRLSPAMRGSMMTAEVSIDACGNLS